MSKRSAPRVRKGQPDVSLTREEFERRWRAAYYDPAFDDDGEALAKLVAHAWDAYHAYRKSPRKRKAGRGFADPSFELPVEWLEARAAIVRAAKTQTAANSPSRILLVAAAMRSDQTCPGEISKTWRLAQLARATIEASEVECDLLDLSRLTSEYGRRIFPCKACVSTAMPLCHWPCSCYPNHALGQVNDWMHEIYPRWVAAHGVMIVTPVYWYGMPAGLKAMADRLVCADGGNPDPTTTKGKDAARAKSLERGWSYPRHLAGRRFAVVVHGDTAGADDVRRALHDWLVDMHLVPAARAAVLDRYIGYFEPYATSHDALDADDDVQAEVRNAAQALVDAVRLARAGRVEPDDGLEVPRPK